MKGVCLIIPFIMFIIVYNIISTTPYPPPIPTPTHTPHIGWRCYMRNIFGEIPNYSFTYIIFYLPQLCLYFQNIQHKIFPRNFLGFSKFYFTTKLLFHYIIFYLPKLPIRYQIMTSKNFFQKFF